MARLKAALHLGADPNHVYRGQTPLMLAIELARFEFSDPLIDAGARIEFQGHIPDVWPGAGPDPPRGPPIRFGTCLPA